MSTGDREGQLKQGAKVTCHEDKAAEPLRNVFLTELLLFLLFWVTIQ